jgi:hypothetical protein
VDILTALLGISTMAGGLIALAWYVFGREADHLAGMYKAHDLGWPRGVQEDDPPPAWSWRSARPDADERGDRQSGAGAPFATAVTPPRIGRGSARRHGRW